eukprot:364681-Chlamydomonas_euryale.AAC.4
MHVPKWGPLPEKLDSLMCWESPSSCSALAGQIEDHPWLGWVGWDGMTWCSDLMGWDDVVQDLIATGPFHCLPRPTRAFALLCSAPCCALCSGLLRVLLDAVLWFALNSCRCSALVTRSPVGNGVPRRRIILPEELQMSAIRAAG